MAHPSFALALSFASMILACGSGSEGGDSQLALPGAPRVLVCGSELARLVDALGASRQVAGVDRDSLEIPAFGAAGDLGTRCRSGPRSAAQLGAELALIGLPDRDLSRRFEAVGTPSLTLAPESLDDLVAIHHRLGALFSRETRASILVSSLTRSIGSLAMRRDARQRTRVAWILEAESPDRLTVVGGVGALHEILELAGAENAFHGGPQPRHAVALREILEASPGLLLSHTPTLPRHAAAGLPPVLAVPAELSRAPLFDPELRIRRLHALLYPE